MRSAAPSQLCKAKKKAANSDEAGEEVNERRGNWHLSGNDDKRCHRLRQPTDPKHVLIVSRWLPAGVDGVGALEQSTNLRLHIRNVFSLRGKE